MAICRCKERHSNPKGRGKEYIIGIEPVGQLITSSICGRTNCENPGLIWLIKDEFDQYQNGTRIFSFSTNYSKVKVI